MIKTIMDSSLLTLKSTWLSQGSDDINNCLQTSIEGEGNSAQEEDSSTSVVLTSSSQSDPPTEPCFLRFACKSGAELIGTTILSNARHAELHDDVDGYVRTIRGEKIPPTSVINGEEARVAYRKEIKLDRPCRNFKLKFVSLADKSHLHLHQIDATLRRGSNNVSSSSQLPGLHGNINMDRVRDLLSSQQPISERAENLMISVEQYQRNQSSAMQGLQEAVADSATNQKPGGGDAGTMGQMSRLLSSLSRTSLSEQMPPSPEAVLKMLASQGGGGGAGAGGDVPGGDSPGSSEGMYSALKVMCRDVTNRRSQDRQRKRDKQCDETPQQEERPSGEGSKNTPSLLIEDRLKPLLQNIEKQIMVKLEARLDSLQAHFDLRLNRLETMLTELSFQRMERKEIRREDDYTESGGVESVEINGHQPSPDEMNGHNKSPDVMKGHTQAADEMKERKSSNAEANGHEQANVEMNGDTPAQLEKS